MMMSSDHADSSALSYDVARSELNIIISEEVLMIPRNFILVYIQGLDHGDDTDISTQCWFNVGPPSQTTVGTDMVL